MACWCPMLPTLPRLQTPYSLHRPLWHIPDFPMCHFRSKIGLPRTFSSHLTDQEQNRPSKQKRYHWFADRTILASKKLAYMLNFLYICMKSWRRKRLWLWWCCFWDMRNKQEWFNEKVLSVSPEIRTEVQLSAEIIARIDSILKEKNLNSAKRLVNKNASLW